ncbi:MAG: hypothetical protein M3384_13645 [Acidobacteriota bacterium]|nr:hypothetical protein [Acidobacteriota bacterium]
MTSEEEKEAGAHNTETENEVSGGGGSELNEPCWSVVSFESVAVHGLTYAEARGWLEKLQKQNVAGLCIVTDEAASRFAGQ